MQPTRRAFLKTLPLAGILAGMSPLASRASQEEYAARLVALDRAAARPVLKRALFPKPVVIADIQLLHHQGSFLCRVRSRDGAEGLCVSNNLRMDYLYPIFNKRVSPFFMHKDARDMDHLVDEVYRYRSNYKMQSYAVGVPVATVEFALLDMLGRMAGVSLGGLLGKVSRCQVPVYLATRFRDRSAEASIDAAKQRIAEKGYRAVKFKIGAKMGNNQELIAGRTETMIPLARQAFGEHMWLGVDANGAYDVSEAIRIGKMLDRYGYAFYEEPVPFDWYRETREVAKQVQTPLAGGEQEASMRNVRWMVAENTLQVYRPDMFYFGGMIRSVKVARMAQVAGFTCVPHISGSGLGYLYALHYISAIDNAGDFHPNSRAARTIPLECRTSSLQVENGQVTVPTGPGLGVDVDPDFIAKHESVKGL